MVRFITIIGGFSLFILISCSTKPGGQNVSTNSDLLLKSGDDDNTPTTLTGKWIILTSTDSGYIYEPCSLSSDNYIEIDSVDSRIVINVNDSFYGEDKFIIDSIGIDSLNQYILYPSKDYSEDLRFLFRWTDQKKRIAYIEADVSSEWSIDNDYIKEADKELYPSYNEPCVRISDEMMKLLDGTWLREKDIEFPYPFQDGLIEFKSDVDFTSGSMTIHNDSDEDDDLTYKFRYGLICFVWPTYESVFHYDVVKISSDSLILKDLLDKKENWVFTRKK